MLNFRRSQFISLQITKNSYVYELEAYSTKMRFPGNTKMEKKKKKKKKKKTRHFGCFLVATPDTS